MIGAYIKKAEVVRAVQWSDETHEDVLRLIGSGSGKVPATALNVRGGVRITAKGDYFIKGADGKIASCDAETFSVLYERAESPKPDFAKPIDLLAYFYEELGACGCSDLAAMITVVRSLLAWIDNKNKPGYASLFSGNTGVYYLLVGQFDRLRLCTHGVSIRHPFLEENGKALLNALNTVDAQTIEDASGEAYNGIWYGQLD